MDTIHRIMLGMELRKKYKSGSAAEIIRDAILSGDISGEIVQNDFADSLGVSRIPVREALITLEYHGLIEKLQNQHVRIINLDDTSIKNVFIDMSLLELEAVKNLSDDKLEHLSSITDQADFHRQVYKNAGSPLRRNFLKIVTETYIIFTLEHSDCEQITPAFETLRCSLKDFDALRVNYAVYAEVLASELINIRRAREEE